MPEAAAPRDILAEVMADGRKALVPQLASMLRRKNIAEVDSTEERERFWLRAKTPEQEAQLWQQALLQRGLTPEALTPEHALDIGLAISKEVYPARWDMASAEGRQSQSEIATWAAGHAAHPPEDQVMGETDG